MKKSIIESLPSPTEYSVDALILQQLDYFIAYTKDVELLIDACAYTARKNGKTLNGAKFTLCIVFEALQLSQSFAAERTTAELQKKILGYLSKSFEISGFNYFNESYLPNDLDTASAMTRILGPQNEKLTYEYDMAVERNRISEGVVSTWLDIKDHQHWFVGLRPYHLDVLLNYWITEADRGRTIPHSIILDTVRNLGLQNYWYLPALYTPYLYCRLLSRMGLQNDSDFLALIVDIINRYESNSLDYILESSSCSFPKVKILISNQSLKDDLNIIMWQMVKSFAEQKISNYKPSKIQFCGELSANRWDTALYWSLGFEAFSSEPVNRAIALSCLSYIKLLGGGYDTIFHVHA